MAFAVASKGAPLTGLLKKLLLAAPAAPALRPASVAAVRRLFNTGAAARFRRDAEDYEEESSGDEDVFCDRHRRCCRARDCSAPTFFSAGPFGEPVWPGRLLALMEDDAAAPTRGWWWVSKEDGDAVQLKVPMPGLGKEHVKVRADQGGLVIEGEDTGDDDEAGPARYGGYIELPSDAFKMDQIKAEMKDGVLKVTVPKIKVEDHKDVFQVKVE